MVKRLSEFVNEGWAAGSIRRASGRNLRKEDIPSTKEELRDIIIKRIESEGNKCDLNDIDVSNITDMSGLFCDDIFNDFNGDISGWDVSNVTDMSSMFSGCKEFNQDISEWDVSNVESMYYMFNGCNNFDKDLNDWDVSNVKHMENMFFGCDKFASAKKLESWKKYTNINMFYMFYKCPYKPEWYGKTKYGIQEIIVDRIKNEGQECDLNDIDISGIKDIAYMFYYEYDFNEPIFNDFNGDISGWDVSGVEDMSCMFFGCAKFNRDISGWDVSGVKNMICMFSGCTGFYEADKLDAWKDILRDDVNIEDMFKACPARPSWYKE